MARNILSVSLIALSVLALLSFVAGGAVKIQQTKYDGDQDITFYRPAKNGKEVAAPLVFKTDGNGKLKGDTTFRMRKSATPGTGLDFDRPTCTVMGQLPADGDFEITLKVIQGEQYLFSCGKEGKFGVWLECNDPPSKC